jgi:O-antigen/teichoic acid export membrane protein
MFSKSLIVISGVGVSQLITLATLPLISRLYDPIVFGFFAIASSVCWLAAVVATMQLEHAIILPKSERKANSLAAAILGIGFIICIFCGFLFLSILYVIPEVLYLNIDKYILTISMMVTIFGIVCTQALRSLLVRRGKFHFIAQGAVLTAVSTTITAILLAVAENFVSSQIGLIWAQAAGLMITSAYWIIVVKKTNALKFNDFKLRRMFATIRIYWKFSITLTSSNVVKTTYGRLPAFIMSMVGGPAAAGLYGLVERVISAPTILLAQAVAGVFKHQAGRYLQIEDTKMIIRAYSSVVVVSALFAVPLFASAVWLSPIMFKIVFGEAWEMAGYYASILLVGEAFVFVLTTVEDTSILVGKNIYRLFWHLGQLLSVGVILLLTYLGKIQGIETILWAFVFIRVMFCLVDLLYFYQILKTRQ